MTDDVAALVLRDNYLQSQALSMLEARAATDLLEHAHTIRSLEVSGLLDRALEFLPTAEEIEERHKARPRPDAPGARDPARLRARWRCTRGSSTRTCPRTRTSATSSSATSRR